MVDVNGGQPTARDPDEAAAHCVASRQHQPPSWRQEYALAVRLALGCVYERQNQNSFERAVSRHVQAQQSCSSRAASLISVSLLVSP